MQYVYPYMSKLPLDGQPLVRPMWWLDPSSSPAVYATSDQFLVGDDILVAPVLDPAVEHRYVYFPAGNWTNVESKCVVNGPANISIPVTLDTIPYYFSFNFMRQFNLERFTQKCRLSPYQGRSLINNQLIN